jgi:hypothetical protein
MNYSQNTLLEINVADTVAQLQAHYTFSYPQIVFTEINHILLEGFIMRTLSALLVSAVVATASVGAFAAPATNDAAAPAAKHEVKKTAKKHSKKAKAAAPAAAK